MLPEDYKIRCDKHNFKPHEYCEMCWLRNEVQNCIETTRKETNHACSSMQLCVSVIHDMLNKHQKQIDDLYERLLGESHG